VETTYLITNVEKLPGCVNCTRALKAASVAKRLLKNVAKRLKIKRGEVLVGELESSGHIAYCAILRMYLGVIEIKKNTIECSLTKQNYYATIFITIYSERRWNVGVGECGGTMESIAEYAYRAFRKFKRSVEDEEFM
jgi:hypothetical protein